MRNVSKATPRPSGPVWPAYMTGSFLILCLVLAGCPEPNPVPPPPPVEGLRVLVVYETDDLDNMPDEQVDIFANQVLRDWLGSSCEEEGGLPAFRFLDKDNDVSRLSQEWQDWFARAKENPLPTLVAAGPGGDYSGPLPADAEAMLKVLMALSKSRAEPLDLPVTKGGE